MNKSTNEDIYYESPVYDVTGQPNFSGSNLLYDEENLFWYMNPVVISDVFDGIQLNINQPHITPTLDSANTGWIGTSSGDMNITITTRESKIVPWDCEVVFTSDISYTSRVEGPFGIYDEFDNRLWFPNRIILGQSFPFYVVNKNYSR